VTPDFAGKTALITGAGRAIGRAIALGLADAGAALILLARSAGQLDETRALLTAQGMAAARIRVVPADLGSEEQRARAVSAALEPGRVDILVNNAATVEPLGVTAAIPAAQLRQAFELNVIAPAALAAAVLPGMLDAGRGRIVNVSSGIVARPRRADSAPGRGRLRIRLGRQRRPPAGSGLAVLRDRGEQPAEVLAARAAGGQVHGRARVAGSCGRIGGDQVDVGGQDLHRPLAPAVRGVGLQEALERGPAAHHVPRSPSSR
jgi:NAD(P)-dependent dehydrogenase (short-subunit alcohol dehydrogenase family)